MRLNKTIVTLIFADLFLYAGWGLITPIYAIFIISQIEGGSLEMVGFAAGVYWIVKSLAQPFLANFLDLKKGEEDDFIFLISGVVIASIVPLGYYFASTLFHVFLLEITRGIAMACVVPSWFGIFGRYINKDWYSFSWSIHSTGLGLILGFSALFGGIFAAILGFKSLFLLVSAFGFCAVFLLFYVKNRIFSDEFKNTSFL